MKEYFEKYDNIITFAESLNRPRKGSFAKDPKDNQNFIGIDSSEKADNLLLYGDTETAKKITTFACKQAPQSTKTSINNAPYGFVPNVPRFLSGRPDNMYNVKAQTYKSTKVLNLIYFVGANYGIKADDLAKEGAKLLRVIATLEGKGYRINLNVATHAKAVNKTHDTLTLFVKVKDSGKPLNLAKVAYPIAHPAFFRFHIWKWLDTQTEAVNYGNNSDNFDNMCKKFNKNAKWVSYATLSEQTEEQILDNILK